LILKRAVAIAQENAELPVAYCQIDTSIMVEVSRDQRGGLTNLPVTDRWLEGSVTIADQYAYDLPRTVRSREIILAVSVKISRYHRISSPCSALHYPRPEGAISIPEENTHRVIQGIRRDQVLLTVSIEITDCHPRVIAARHIIDPGLEGSVAFPRNTDTTGAAQKGSMGPKTLTARSGMPSALKSPTTRWLGDGPVA
jgi:hypothetical protein